MATINMLGRVNIGHTAEGDSVDVSNTMEGTFDVLVNNVVQETVVGLRNAVEMAKSIVAASRHEAFLNRLK